MRRRGVQLLVVLATALLLASGIALAEEEVWKTVKCDPSTPDDPCLGDQGGISQDIIKGTKNGDYINALYEKDIVEAGGQGDFVYGSFGADHLYGDYVHETIVDENDKPIFEETKVDENLNPVSAIDGDDPDYMDKLYGEHGDDHLYGGPGPDVLDGSLDDDTLEGQQGNDKLYGSIGTDDLSGGDGCDILYGSLGGDTIDAKDSPASNCVDDEGINDKVYGEDGDDTIDAGDGKKDKIYCGFGEDTVNADNVDEFPVPENCEHVLPEITTIDSQPPKLTNSKTASFTFSSDPVGTSFECKLDNGSFAACPSPQVYSNLSEGTHTFEVRAITDGNVDKTPARYSWTVDTTAPDTTIGSKPASTTSSTSASFTFSSSESISNFECQLDNAGFSDCGSGSTVSKSYSNLTADDHTFEVRATDAAGNVDASPASYTWTVSDTTPPTVKTVTPTNGATGVPRTNTIVTATFSEEMDASTITTPATFRLLDNSTGTRVDAEPVSCDSPCKTATLKPKANLIAGRKYKAVVTTGVKDVAGNAMTQNKVWYFTAGS